MRRDLFNAVLASMRGKHQKAIGQVGTSEPAAFQQFVPISSNTSSDTGGEKRTNKINCVPTVPTVPTQTLGGNRERVENGLSSVRTGVGTASEHAGTKTPISMARHCSCGIATSHATGWFLHGSGGERWFCAECLPSLDDVVAVAGVGGAFSSPREQAFTDWWRQPVTEWAEGRLSITNLVTGRETIIDLRGRL